MLLLEKLGASRPTGPTGFPGLAGANDHRELLEFLVQQVCISLSQEYVFFIKSNSIQEYHFHYIINIGSIAYGNFISLFKCPMRPWFRPNVGLLEQLDQLMQTELLVKMADANGALG